MGSSGGGGGSSSTTQTSEPWGYQEGFLKNIYKRAMAESKNPLEYYQGETVAPFSQETEQALAGQTQRAEAGSPLVSGAQDLNQSIIAGDYLNSGNPHFQQMADRIRGQVQPGIDARFATSGASGSPLANRALGLGLGDAIGGLAYQNYGDERSRQTQATAMAPQLANQDYYDLAKLAEVGAQREGLTQQQINEDMSRYQFEQMEPWKRLQMYNAIITGSNPGGTITTTGPSAPGRSPIGAGLAGGLGGAATGAGIANIVPGLGPGLGAALGGGLGLLSGIF